ncbi:hypothetical protein LMH87_006296 [Akanthomyces muscarius]|uniref:Reticulon-like protein n=1 Tax=Akanthomyces muscarius TaxID=2231603 RepID=A0A9W8USW4_AKAMU|nr:hypothetical protein LMH87_006296 [Akanthomyces muscarius]KAJ4164633.1 hypothetical protein LMH87_006296 [Akanthomyces muscarius]
MRARTPGNGSPPPFFLSLLFPPTRNEFCLLHYHILPRHNQNQVYSSAGKKKYKQPARPLRQTSPPYHSYTPSVLARLSSKSIQNPANMTDIADATLPVNGASPFEKNNASVAPKPAANGRKSLDAQPVTHYHSFFAELLSWKNPRNSAIAYGSIVTFILAARYFDIIRWAFKLSWMTLAVTISAEVAGKLVLNNGITSQLRPRRYYTIHRDTVDGIIGDVHELANFFIIEGQRILFAENIGVSAIAGLAAFISYFLVKLVPYWGLAILGTTLAFFVPLVYAANKELIDEHLQNASEVINAQTAQVRDAAQKQADQLTTLGKQYAGDYTGKVQDMIRGRPAPTAASAAPEKIPVAKAKGPDFPVAPTEEPVPVAKEAAPETTELPEIPAVPEQEPLIAA